MNKNLQMEFLIDKKIKTVTIKKEFASTLNIVWDAFTKQEHLDNWGAPSPMKSKTKYMDFKISGKRFYAMVSPDGNENWVIQEYTSISPKTHFKMNNAFADKDGNPHPVGSVWDFNFSEENGTTKVIIKIFNESFERMEMMLEFGFEAGYTATLENLEKLLAKLI